MCRLFILLTLVFRLWLLPTFAGDRPALVLQETLSRGLGVRGVNLQDPGEVFAVVFDQLPAEVKVMPTENYFYWQLFCDGREIRGNIRLPSGQREKGILSFGYAE